MKPVGTRATRSGVAVSIAAVFALDAVAPVGIDVPILYLLPLLVVFLTERIPTRVAVTCVVSLLTAISMGREWGSGGDWTAASVNRVLDSGVFWVALALSIRDARTTRQLRDLRRALDTASIVAVVDTKGCITDVNDRFCALSGYSRQELIGRPHELLASHGDPGAAPQGLWSTIASGAIWHGEIRGRAAGGRIFWADTTIVPFLSDGGMPYLYLAIHHDVTEQKQAEIRLRSQAALAKIAEMAALVAHEVRNPVAGVRGILQLFEARPSLSPADLRLTRHMIERLDLLDAHIKALVQYAEPRSPRLETVAIRPLLEEVVASLQRESSNGATQYDVRGSDARVLGDREMLQKAFSHLLANAREAQSATGRIEITVGDAGDTASVAVSDTGTGIAPELHERIFEPFYTTKPAAAGLGLSLVRQLVELHGGDIAVRASSPSGTTIQVRLPLAAQAVTAVA